MISKRTLEIWRKDALNTEQLLLNLNHIEVKVSPLEPSLKEFANRIIRLTAELLDQHLMKR